MNRIAPLAPLVTLALMACTAPDPAPVEVEGLSHYFLTHYGDEEPDALLEGMVNLSTWYSENVGEGDLGGTLEDVTRAEIDTMGMPASTDPSEVVGVFHLIPQQCTMEDLTAIFLHPHQDELFTDSYTSYQRDFRQDPSCFPGMECEQLTWDVQISSNLALSIDMTYPLISGVRWADDPDDEHPPILLSRTHMPEEAEVDGTAYFDQSYQIEVLVPWTDTTTLHFYALWNAGGMEGLDPEADFWKDQYLNGIIDYDLQIDALCATRSEWE